MIQVTKIKNGYTVTTYGATGVGEHEETYAASIPGVLALVENALEDASLDEDERFEKVTRLARDAMCA